MPHSSLPCSNPQHPTRDRETLQVCSLDGMSVLVYNNPMDEKELVWLHGEVKTPPFRASHGLRRAFCCDGYSRVSHCRCRTPARCLSSDRGAMSCVFRIRIRTGESSTGSMQMPLSSQRCLKRDRKPRQTPSSTHASADWRNTIEQDRTMVMDAEKRARLEAAGFKVGTVEEFLGLSPEESALIEVRLALSTALRRRRQTLHLAQSTLAKRLQSSQSRVAKMEAGDPSVSIDLLLRALLATGATREEVGQVISAGSDQP